MTTLIEKRVGDLDDKRDDSDARWPGGTEHDSPLRAIERGIDQEIEHEIDEERARVVKAIERAEAEGARS